MSADTYVPFALFKKQLPSLPTAAFSGVRTRRLLALIFDASLISFAALFIVSVLAIPTFLLSFLLLPLVFTVLAFFYNGFSLSSRNMGTLGMRLFDLEVGLQNGRRVPFFDAAVHAILFYLSWSFMPIFLVTFFSAQKQFAHDIALDMVFTRRTL